MALLDQTVIARNPSAVPRSAAIERELLAPAGLLVGTDRRGWQVGGWAHEGEHLRVQLQGHCEVAVLIGPRRDDNGAFVRTAAWNVAYRDGPFSAELAELLGEVAAAAQAAADALHIDAEGARIRWFAKPERDQVLEVSPGKKLYVRVTDHCDEYCVFCNATEGNANIVESKSAVAEILQRLPAGQLSQVIFSGGEPTLVKSLPQMVALAYERGARQIIIQTNGVALAADGALEAYLPFKDRLGLGFSLHATEAALSAQMLDHGDETRFAAKLQAIDRAVAMGFAVKITCVVMRPNLPQVPQFARWAWQRWGQGVHRLQFSYAMPRGNAWLNRHLLLQFSECVAPFAEAYDFGRQVGLRIETSQSCCVPPCVMPSYVDHYDIYGDFAGKVSDPERCKPAETCTGCNWDRVCAGVWQRYIDVFGTSELRAITDRPEPPHSIEDFIEPEVLDLSAC